MKSLAHHINHIKSKPHHVRRRIAFGVAGALAVFIGVVWIAGSLSLGTFAVNGSSFAQSTGAEVPVPQAGQSSQQAALAGAAAALQQTETASHIEIVNPQSPTATTASSSDTAGQTIIPF